MIRRPPRSTLFPYNDALPISLNYRHRVKFSRIIAADCFWISQQHRPLVVSFCLFLERSLSSRIFVVAGIRSEEHTSELQSQSNLVCRLLLEKKKTKII